MKKPTHTGATLPATPCSSSFVRMFKPQFAGLVERGEKLQTVRPVPKRMPKTGDRISLRAWSDKPYRSKQKLLAEGIISRVVPITITAEAVLIRPTPQLTVHVPRGPFAVADGFSCWEEMRQWFERQHGLPFDGVLISWTNAKEHAPPLARASNDQGVLVGVTLGHENRAASGGCCVSTCSASFTWSRVFKLWAFYRRIQKSHL